MVSPLGPEGKGPGFQQYWGSAAIAVQLARISGDISKTTPDSIVIARRLDFQCCPRFAPANSCTWNRCNGRAAPPLEGSRRPSRRSRRAANCDGAFAFRSTDDAGQTPDIAPEAWIPQVSSGIIVYGFRPSCWQRLSSATPSPICTTCRRWTPASHASARPALRSPSTSSSPSSPWSTRPASWRREELNPRRENSARHLCRDLVKFDDPSVPTICDEAAGLDL